jgi:DNA-binding response OmpR family regulator
MNDRDKIEELEEEIRQLKDMMAEKDSWSRWKKFGLTRTESSFLSALFARDATIGYEYFMNIRASKKSALEVDGNLIRQFIKRIRDKTGLQIPNDYGVGYYLSDEDRAKLREMAE